MKKLTGILFLFFALISFSKAQVNFIAADGNADQGDTLQIIVTADNFNGVLSFEYRQSFDTNFFEFIDIVDIHNDLTGFSYVGPMDMAQPQEFIGFSWFEQTGTAVNLPNGSELYTLRFIARGNPGDMDSIKFIPARNGFEVSDENNDPIPYTLDNGLMTINGGSFKVFLAEGTGDKDDQICLDLSVDNFIDIETMQLAFLWDKDVATYATTKDFNLKNFSLGSLASPRPGVLRITWEEGTGSSLTLTGKTKIASVCFDLTGNAGTATNVNLGDDGSFKIEVSDKNGDELTVVPVNGKLTINDGGGGPKNFTFIASNEKADKNSNVCVDVSVREFTNVAGMQFTMAWDKNTLTNANIQNTNLKDLDASGSFNIQDGTLTCSWSDQDVDGITVANNTVIFQLCFTTSSDCGAKSSVIFNNTDKIDIFDPDLNDITPVDVENGEVEIDCGGGGGGDNFELTVKGGSVEEDSEICVDVDVKNFTNIEAMQFSLSWDPSIVKYNKVDNINLPGFNSSSYSENPIGKLRVAFSPINPVTFIDGTMFQVCYQGVDCDKSTNLEFVNSPLTIEVTDGNSDDVNVTTTNSSVNVTCKTQSDISVSILNKRDVRCKDDCNGSISIKVEGVTNHTSEWFKDNENTPFSTGKNGVGNLCPGNYYVIVTDVNDPNNKDTSEVSVLGNPDALTLRLSNSARDNGNCTGGLEVIGIGGWGMYSYVWVSSPQPQQRTRTLIDACKGNMHIVNIIDGGNCNIRDTFTVYGPEIKDNAELTSLNCKDDCNAEIKLSPIGGCPPLTYKWSGAGTDETAQNQDKLCAGTYSVTITDTLGDQITKSFTIDNPDGVVITLDGIINGTNGSINVTITGGAIPYSFVWTDKDGNVVSQQEDLAGVSSGTYTLVVTDNNGCSQSADYTIPPDEFSVTFDSNNVSCNDGNDGQIDITVMPAGNVDYQWSHDGSLNDPKAENLTAGDYTVIVKDKTDGTILWQMDFTITEPDELVITSLNEINCATVEGSRNGSYEVVVEGGTPGYGYEWCNGETTSTATRLRGGDDCDILVTDANGCQVFMDEISICSDSINPEPPSECYEARKVISPNNDGKNDELLISCDNDFPNKIFIYDRWGRSVFEQIDYNSTTGLGWTGVDSNGNELNEGGYMWVLRVDLPNGDQRIYRGTVILVR